MRKLVELDTWARTNDYPFLIQMRFDDKRLCLGLTVGSTHAILEFIYACDVEGSDRPGPCYVVNPLGDVDEIVPIYYWGHWTEPDTTKMLPQDQVLEAVLHFAEFKQFPPNVTFNDDEANRRFVEH